MCPDYDPPRCVPAGSPPNPPHLPAGRPVVTIFFVLLATVLATPLANEKEGGVGANAAGEANRKKTTKAMLRAINDSHADGAASTHVDRDVGGDDDDDKDDSLPQKME